MLFYVVRDDNLLFKYQGGGKCPGFHHETKNNCIIYVEPGWLAGDSPVSDRRSKY